MAKANISKSILSITDPGTNLVFGADPEKARKLTRDCNVFAADIKKRRPDQFGFWAALPLPDIEGSLKELAFALDELQADGIGVMTNHHGIYLGDPAFDPIFTELNRRRATIFIHPTVPCVAKGCNGLPQSATPLPQFGPAMFEFLFDEARAVINLISSGLAERFPHVKVIVPHGGGTLPSLVERFTGMSEALIRMGYMKNSHDLSNEAVSETLKNQFYFDLAGFPFPNQIHGLLRHVGVDQLLYGSDYCYTPAPLAIGLAEKVDAGLRELFKDEDDIAKVYRLNAEELLAKNSLY
jgi:predicted TIM-barrel fold metal-dependent hydrolase